tara:strand:- start:908 stop:1417 length:510 start_codon:yes stop_codon:yes gene_type:complete
MKRLLFLIFSGFFIGFVYFFSLSLSKPKLPDISLQEGKKIPFFQELIDLNGEIINTQRLTSGAVLLNVWASWCITCLVEHPFLTKLSEDNNLVIIGINYKDDLSKAKKYLDENGDPYEFSVFDFKGDYALKLGVTGAPETFLIIDGKIVKHRIGEINKKVWNDEFKLFF